MFSTLWNVNICIKRTVQHSKVPSMNTFDLLHKYSQFSKNHYIVYIAINYWKILIIFLRPLCTSFISYVLTLKPFQTSSSFESSEIILQIFLASVLLPFVWCFNNLSGTISACLIGMPLVASRLTQLATYWCLNFDSLTWTDLWRLFQNSFPSKSLPIRTI